MKTEIPIEEIKALGFDVYTREPVMPSAPVTYAFFTDGVNIGYIQIGRNGGMYSLGTVHKPCRECGTGYSVGSIDIITKEALDVSFIHHPNWAKKSDIKSIVKYKDWDEYKNFNSFNKEYKKS